MSPFDKKLKELVADLDEAHSAAIRADRAYQTAQRMFEDAESRFHTAKNALKSYVATDSPSTPPEKP